MKGRAVTLGACTGVLVSVLLSACALGNAAAPLPEPLTEAQRARAVETGDQLDQLFRAITAPSVDHVNASQLLARRGEQTAMRECMEEAGLAYGPSFNSGPSWTEEDMEGGFGAATWLSPHGDDMNWALDSIDLLAYVKELVPDFRNFDRDVPPQEETKDGVSRRCEAKADAAFVLFPPTRDELYGSLNEMVDGFDRDLDKYYVSYRDCMDEAGFDVDSPHQIVEMLQRESYRMNLVAPDPGVDANDAWLAMLERERAATAASNECSRPLFESGMYAMRDALDAWEAKHAEQLKQITKEWDAMLAEALTYPEANQVFIDLPPLLSDPTID